MSSFDPIRPGDIDSFSFDFSVEIGSGASITDAAWACAVSANSPLTDATPADRLIGLPTFSATKTSHQAGLMLVGVIYTLTATVTLNDGRILSHDADLECVLRPDLTVPDLTIEQFRAEFPAFASTSDYPDTQVGYWIDQAVNFSPIDEVRWGQFYLQGLRLYVAHNLALERMGLIQARTGAPVGAGVPASKSVGGVSISYDVEFGSEQDGGNWSMTIWGSRFLRLLRMAGSGGIQL